MPIGFSQPVYLWLLLLAAPVIWSGWRFLRPLSKRRRQTAIAIRVLALGLIVLMLAGVQMVREHEDLTVVAVVDESESMQRFAPRDALDAQTTQPVNTLGDWTRQWLGKAMVDRRVDDRLGLVTYDARPTVVAMPSTAPPPGAGIIPQPREGSRGGAAIRLAMAMLPPDTARRLVLVSDGNDTAQDDLLAAARQAAGAGVPIDVLPVDYTLGHEVIVEGLYTPSQARQGQTAPVRIVLRASAPADGQLYLIRNGQALDLNGQAPGQGAPVTRDQWTAASQSPGQDEHEDEASLDGRYTLVRHLNLPLVDNGANRFEAVFEPAQGQDAVAANNRATAFTLVQGQGKVLVLSHEPPDQSRLLVSALQSHGIVTETAPGNGLPGDLAALSRYDAIVMQNVPAEQMDQGQQALLTQYVADTGGGLVVLGGPDSFGAGGWNNTPLSRIFPVDCQLPGQLILPTGALVIVIDRSGSMSSTVTGSAHNKQEIAAEAAVLAITSLYPRDMVGVVSFDSSARWDVPLAIHPNRREVIDKVRAIGPEGGTHIFSGLEAAYNALAMVDVDQAAVKHIILLTDGQSSGGDFPDLLARMRQHEITLSTIGVGDDVDNSMLTSLAREGRGEYYPVKDPTKLPQVFIKEARTIRKNLIRETNFTPALVRSGSPLTAGLDAVPQLQGFVRTAPRRDPRVFMAMVGPEDEPILAHWQVGLGQVTAFTSDTTTRWGARWATWPGHGDFWSRLVRAAARPASSADMELVTSFTGDHLTIRIDTTRHADGSGGEAEPAGAFAQMRDLAAAVVGPDGQKHLVNLAQTGPGLYEATVPAAASGSYLVSVLGFDGQGRRQFVSGGANRPAGLELRRFAANPSLLREIAAMTGGRVLTASPRQVTGLFTRDGSMQPSRAIRPMWRWLLWLLLPMFLMDVAVRRLSWDAAALRAWLGMREAAEESAAAAGAAADALAGVLRKRGGQATAAAQRPKVEDAPAAPRPSPASPAPAKAASPAPVKPSSSRPESPPSSQQPPQPKQSPRPSQAGTSRLLDAKRRARQRLEEQ